MATYSRISARRGNYVVLDMSFMRGGVLTDPYAIVKVDIYKTQIAPHNLVATFVMPDPCDPLYPAPLSWVTTDVPAGDCGTEAQPGVPIPGKYELLWLVPCDAVAPDVYFDVWTYFPSNPCDCIDSTECGTVCPDLSSDAFASAMLTTCGRFWVYPDNWYANDGLTTIRLGFEPLDQKFQYPERRPLEIGIMPLPLYDYDFNLVAPILPYLQGTISIWTANNELLADKIPMEIGLRQGSYRTNPYVLRYMLDTACFIKGTYNYRVTVTLPDGTTRTSKDFVFTVS